MVMLRPLNTERAGMFAFTPLIKELYLDLDGGPHTRPVLVSSFSLAAIL